MQAPPIPKGKYFPFFLPPAAVVAPAWQRAAALVVVAAALLGGCATPRAYYSYKTVDPVTGKVLKQGTVSTNQDTVVEDLEITTPTATIRAKRIDTRTNPEVIRAQAERERGNTEAGIKGAIEGAAAAAALAGS